MMNLLHTIGLMTRAEHARKVEILVDLLDETRAAESKALAQFKRAATDLAAQAEEIAGYRQALARAENMMDQASERLAEIREERDDLRPDALAMRRKRQMDRDRRKGR